MKTNHVILLVFSMFLMAFGLPNNIQKKIDKEITKTFEIEDFSFTEFKIPNAIASKVKSKFNNDNLFKIEVENKLVGYAYVSQAPSKTALFDYLVLLDTDLVVKKSKVLVYREEYGGEIGSARWLKQFIGKNQDDSLKYGENIMAISGATISVRSMTNAMNDLLQSLKVLHSNNII
ncbi:FMN-binding protein [Gaetbulibacter saemankumensis]|uniref:FMN-binding protein n=1 Tax=Gaetbulibacter saemankumensis TaxID=311208 RepID=UPI0004825063|nr:FMN-binding protein [Gaetbulibacter saemankumensis]